MSDYMNRLKNLVEASNCEAEEDFMMTITDAIPSLNADNASLEADIDDIDFSQLSMDTAAHSTQHLSLCSDSNTNKDFSLNDECSFTLSPLHLTINSSYLSSVSYTPFSAIDETIMFRISDFIPRLEHFTVLAQVSKQLSKVFSTERYFNSRSKSTHLFKRDSAYFERCIKPRFFRGKADDNGGIAIAFHSMNVSIISDQIDNNELKAMLKFYTTFYDRFLALQQRYNRMISGRHCSLQRCEDSAADTNRRHLSVFPIVVRAFLVCEALSSDDLRWICDVIHYSSPSNGCFSSVDLSHCELRNDQIIAISNALMTRKYFSPITRLDLSHNSDISDVSMSLLFRSIGEQCPKMAEINLNNTDISDLTCVIVGNYFTNYINVIKDSLVNVYWNNTRVTAVGEASFLNIINSQICFEE